MVLNNVVVMVVRVVLVVIVVSIVVSKNIPVHNIQSVGISSTKIQPARIPSTQYSVRRVSRTNKFGQ